MKIWKCPLRQSCRATEGAEKSPDLGGILNQAGRFFGPFGRVLLWPSMDICRASMGKLERRCMVCHDRGKAGPAFLEES